MLGSFERYFGMCSILFEKAEMKVKKKFYVVEAHGGKYIVPDRKVEKITSRTLIIKDQLCQFLNANISPEASKITVTIES